MDLAPFIPILILLLLVNMTPCLAGGSRATPARPNTPVSVTVRAIGAHLYAPVGPRANPPLRVTPVFPSATNNTLPPEKIAYTIEPLNGSLLQGRHASNLLVSPTGLEFDSLTNQLLVGDAGGNDVFSVNASTGRLVRAISDFPTSTGSDPESFALDPRTDILWVANQGAGITAIDLTNDTLIKRIPLTAGADGIAYDPINGMVYAVGFDGNLTVVNATTQSVVGVRAVGAGCQQSLAFDPASDSIYVGGGGCRNGVLVVDPTTLNTTAQIQAPVAAGLDAYAVMYDPVANVMVLPSVTSGNVSFVNATTNTLLTTVTLDSTAGFVTGLAINLARQEIYVSPAGLTDGTGIAVLNASSLAYERELPGRGGPTWMQYDPTRNDLFEVDQGSGTISIWNGLTDTLSVPSAPMRTPYFGATYDGGNGLVYIATNNAYDDCTAPGSLTVLDPSVRPNLGGSIPTGDGPQQVAVDPATHRIYVTNLCSNTVSVIDDQNNSLVNLSVPVGSGPEGIAIDPDNGLVYISDIYDGSIWTINQTTLASSRLLNFSNDAEPSALAYDSTNHRMFVALYGADNVAVINTTSGALLPTTIPVGVNPQALMFDSANGVVYVACSASAALFLVNASSLTSAGSIPTDQGPVAMALDATAGILYVANVNSGSVDLINTSSETRLSGYVRVLTAPLGIAYVPADNQLDVTDENFGTVSVLANAPEIVSLTASPNSTETGVRTYLTGQVSNGTEPYDYSVGNLPAGCGPNTGFDLNCSIATPGVYRIYFNVTDAAGYAGWGILRLAVRASFGQVDLSAIPTVLDTGQTLVLQLNVSGGTSPLSFGYFGLPTGCVSVDNATLACRPESAGTFNISAQISDAIGGVVEASTGVTVNPPPMVLDFATNPPVAYPNSSITISTVVAGGTGPLTYSYRNLPEGCSSASLPALLCVPSEPGNYSLSVVVTDSSNDSTSAATQLLVAVRPPLALEFGVFPSRVTLGGTVEFTAIAENASGSVAFAYSGLPPGCAPASEPVLTCSPRSTGNFSVELVVSDGLGRNTTAKAALQVQLAPTNVGDRSNNPMELAWETAGALALLSALAGAVLGGIVFRWLDRRRGRVSESRTEPNSDEDARSDRNGSPGQPPDGH
ncbi:MAG: hypothetical protein L3K16_06125 [Thermoplasmata archaeon]|nr:hypothetical protein [Thermoplasmata archaeon]